VTVESPASSSTADRFWDRAYLLVLGLVFLASIGMTVFSLKYGDNKVLILGDGKNYYIWARSIVLDGDIDFRNDYQIMSASDSSPLPWEAAVRTPAGHVLNKYPVGMAILEVPGLLLGHVIARYVVRSLPDGVSPPYQMAVVWSLLVLYFGSFVLLYRLMSCVGVARIWGFAFCLTALVGTNLIYYVAKEPTMAHASGAAVLNILLFLVVRWGGGHARIRPAPGILLGALVGLLFLIRNTNVLLLPVLAAVAWTRRRGSLREATPILVGAACIAALQPVSLWFLWGRPRLSTYINESFTSGVSGVIKALVSARHGLLVYHPWYAALLLLAAYGALRLPQARRVCIAAIVSFLLVAVANGTWWCWWFGHSFGNRAFIEILPALSLVGALSASRLNLGGRATAALVVFMLAIVAVNLYLCAGYILQGFPHDGSHTVAQAYLWVLSHSPGSLINRLAH
jgi:hypothetical protein